MKNKLKDISIIILFFVLLFPIISCNDEEKTEERADYVVKQMKDSVIYVYDNGRGLLVLHRGDNIENSTNINVQVITDERMKYKLSSETLTNNNRISELEIYPDSSLPNGSYKFMFVCSYGNNIDTIKTRIQKIKSLGLGSISDINEYSDWLYTNNSTHDISGETGWVCYDMNGGDGCIMVKYLNDNWDITKYFLLTGTSTVKQIAFRRRFIEASYSLALQKVEGYLIKELPVKNFLLYDKK